jgi:acetyl-CoA acyltransferase
VRSHTLAAAARDACFTSREVFQVETLKYDEGIRDNPDPAKMASLKTVFKPDGVITAGNSSQISDGAAAVLLASGEKAAELGLRKRARVLTRVAVGSDPVLMLDGPIAATRKALARAGLTIHDIDAMEINEAFASVPLAWAAELKPDMNRLNMQGGAIAHGHPLGATGAALMTKLVNILERTGGRYGLQAMCIGFGMATATVIERLD